MTSEKITTIRRERQSVLLPPEGDSLEKPVAMTEGHPHLAHDGIEVREFTKVPGM